MSTYTDSAAEIARADAERSRIETAAEIERQKMLRAAEREARSEERAERAAERAERRAHHAGQIRARLAAFSSSAARSVPFVTLLAANALAATGQLGYAKTEITLRGFDALNGWPVAIVFAAFLESIALFLGYHAARALRRRDSALGKQLAAYAVAFVVAGINYSHFCDPGWKPNATAVTFALASLVSPWLWSIHSRAVHRDELYAAGEIDPRNPKLSTARKVWHPIDSIRVIAWSSWAGARTPAEAIAAWEAAGRPGLLARARQRRALQRALKGKGQLDLALLLRFVMLAPAMRPGQNDAVAAVDQAPAELAAEPADQVTAVPASLQVKPLPPPIWAPAPAPVDSVAPAELAAEPVDQAPAELAEAPTRPEPEPEPERKPEGRSTVVQLRREPRRPASAPSSAAHRRDVPVAVTDLPEGLFAGSKSEAVRGVIEHLGTDDTQVIVGVLSDHGIDVKPNYVRTVRARTRNNELTTAVSSDGTEG